MKIKLMRILILFSIFVSVISINSFNTTATDEKYYLKAIVPYGYVPRNNLTMDPLYYTNENTNGTIYQNGSNPYVFRNHLLISDFEKVDSFFLKTISIGTLKDQFLWKAFSALYKENISYYYNDIYYLKRWTIFVIVANDTPPTYPQDGFFYTNRSNWQNFISQGFWYINQPQKCIAIWLWECNLCDNKFGQVEEVANEIIEVIRITFPFYDLAYLESNYYPNEYSNFSEYCINNLSTITENKLTTDVEILNNKISECMIRKAKLNVDFSNLFHISAPFDFRYSDSSFIDLIKGELEESVNRAIDQNEKNLEILQETKSIIQNELYARTQHSEAQRDYSLTVLSVLVGGVIAGISTLGVSLYLQKNERLASRASQQRVEFYEPLYNEVFKINKDLTEFKCPFNAKETLKIWGELKPSAKNKIPDLIKGKITEYNRMGRGYYNLYIEFLKILDKKINSVMNRYKVDGLIKGEVNPEQIELRNTFASRKQGIIPEYQSDFFAGRLLVTPGRRSLERLCSTLKNKKNNESRIFERISSSLESEQSIIELRRVRAQLLNFSQEFESELKNKIDKILNDYEKNLKKI